MSDLAGNVPTQATPRQVLEDCLAVIKELDARYDSAALVGDNSLALMLVRQRAQELVDLPAKVEQTLALGHTFPADELDNLRKFASQAQEAMDANNQFAMAGMLTTREMRVGDANLLGLLIARVYPPKTN